MQVLINGLGRSGTTWVQKTFDQHPSVFSSFEPERLIDPGLKRRLSDPTDTTAVGDYIAAIFSCRGLRAMRKRPILRKSYRTEAAHLVRLGFIYGMSAPGKFSQQLRRRVEYMAVPDLADLRSAVHVVKSVSQQYELPRIARESPALKVIYLVRHPCAQVSSHMRGLEAGKMSESYLPPREDMNRLYEFKKPASELTEADFSQLEINAYRWAVCCDLNYLELAELPNTRLVTYEELCEDPEAVFRSLFSWVGLDWHENCARFIRESLQETADASEYHGLVRNPTIAANKWKSEMSLQDVETVKSICRKSAAAALYADLHS